MTLFGGGDPTVEADRDQADSGSSLDGLSDLTTRHQQEDMRFAGPRADSTMPFESGVDDILAGTYQDSAAVRDSRYNIGTREEGLRQVGRDGPSDNPFRDNRDLSTAPATASHDDVREAIAEPELHFERISPIEMGILLESMPGGLTLRQKHEWLNTQLEELTPEDVDGIQTDQQLDDLREDLRALARQEFIQQEAVRIAGDLYPTPRRDPDTGEVLRDPDTGEVLMEPGRLQAEGLTLDQQLDRVLAEIDPDHYPSRHDIILLRTELRVANLMAIEGASAIYTGLSADPPDLDKVAGALNGRTAEECALIIGAFNRTFANTGEPPIGDFETYVRSLGPQEGADSDSDPHLSAAEVEEIIGLQRGFEARLDELAGQYRHLIQANADVDNSLGRWLGTGIGVFLGGWGTYNADRHILPYVSDAEPGSGRGPRGYRPIMRGDRRALDGNLIPERLRQLNPLEAGQNMFWGGVIMGGMGSRNDQMRELGSAERQAQMEQLVRGLQGLSRPQIAMLQARVEGGNGISEALDSDEIDLEDLATSGPDDQSRAAQVTYTEADVDRIAQGLVETLQDGDKHDFEQLTAVRTVFTRLTDDNTITREVEQPDGTTREVTEPVSAAIQRRMLELVHDLPEDQAPPLLRDRAAANAEAADQAHEAAMQRWRDSLPEGVNPDTLPDDSPHRATMPEREDAQPAQITMDEYLQHTLNEQAAAASSMIDTGFNADRTAAIIVAQLRSLDIPPDVAEDPEALARLQVTMRELLGEGLGEIGSDDQLDLSVNREQAAAVAAKVQELLGEDVPFREGLMAAVPVEMGTLRHELIRSLATPDIPLWERIDPQTVFHSDTINDLLERYGVIPERLTPEEISGLSSSERARYEALRSVVNEVTEIDRTALRVGQSLPPEAFFERIEELSPAEMRLRLEAYERRHSIAELEDYDEMRLELVRQSIESNVNLFSSVASIHEHLSNGTATPERIQELLTQGFTEMEPAERIETVRAVMAFYEREHGDALRVYVENEVPAIAFLGQAEQLGTAFANHRSLLEQSQIMEAELEHARRQVNVALRTTLLSDRLDREAIRNVDAAYQVFFADGRDSSFQLRHELLMHSFQNPNAEQDRFMTAVDNLDRAVTDDLGELAVRTAETMAIAEAQYQSQLDRLERTTVDNPEQIRTALAARRQGQMSILARRLDGLGTPVSTIEALQTELNPEQIAQALDASLSRYETVRNSLSGRTDEHAALLLARAERRTETDVYDLLGLSGDERIPNKEEFLSSVLDAAENDLNSPVVTNALERVRTENYLTGIPEAQRPQAEIILRGAQVLHTLHTVPPSEFGEIHLEALHGLYSQLSTPEGAAARSSIQNAYDAIYGETHGLSLEQRETALVATLQALRDSPDTAEEIRQQAEALQTLLENR